MAVESSPSSAKHENVEELVAIVGGDRRRRLEIFMRAREVIRKIIGDHADHIFWGLFERPGLYEQDALCILGRMREFIGDFTPDKVRALVELSKIDGFGFVARLLADAICARREPDAPINATQKSAKRQTQWVCGTELVSRR